MISSKILVIEDDKRIREMIKEYLPVLMANNVLAKLLQVVPVTYPYP